MSLLPTMCGVGDRVTLKCGAQLWDGVTLEDDVFVGSHALLLKDKFPRGKPETDQRTLIRAGASIGAKATIMPGVTVGKKAVVEVGAVVTHDVPCARHRDRPPGAHHRLC
jgi:acetyltransferase-like isoleucine patch superfamily enzyme